MNEKKEKVCVIGLGYVGLPLALAFGEKYKTLGFDISKKRIESLNNKIDYNLEHSKTDFLKSKYLKFSNNVNDIYESNIYIVTVPTPIYKNKKLDLRYITKATRLVANNLKDGDYVIFE